MSSLMDNEKRYLEKLFGMSDGYFLDYKDHTFGELFNRHNIDIHGRIEEGWLNKSLQGYFG